MSKRPGLVCDPSKRPLRRGLEGKRVRVHLNLHNGCYVVSSGGKVQGYVHALVLSDASTKVMRGGYDRCRKERTRNVHAYLEGVLVSHGSGFSVPAGARRVSYNCLTHPPCFYFSDTNGCFTSAARVVCLPGAQVWATGARNPDGSVDRFVPEQAFVARARARADEAAGHDAADYWRGWAAGSFVTGGKRNPLDPEEAEELNRWRMELIRFAASLERGDPGNRDAEEHRVVADAYVRVLRRFGGPRGERLAGVADRAVLQRAARALARQRAWREGLTNPGHRHPRLALPISREQVEEELRELYHRGGQRGYPQIAWPSDLTRLHEKNTRRYAQVVTPGGGPTLAGRGAPRFELAEQARWLPAPHRTGLLAHEVGHVLAPGGSEGDADEAARAALGVRVGYDHRWPGKGLQVARKKRARASGANPAPFPLSEGETARLHRVLGSRVKAARELAGVSQRKLAEIMGRSPSWVREVEAGAQYAPPYLLLPLAQAAGKSLEWFYGAPDVEPLVIHRGVPGAEILRAGLRAPNPAELEEVLGGQGEIDPSAAVVLSDSERRLLEAAEHADRPFTAGQIGSEITSRKGGALLAGRLAPKLVGMGFLTRTTELVGGRPLSVYQVTEKGRQALQLLTHREGEVSAASALEAEITRAELPEPPVSFDPSQMERVIAYEPLDAGPHVVIRVWDRSPYLYGADAVVGEAWVRKGPGDDRSFGRPPAGYAPVEHAWLVPAYEDLERELYQRAAEQAATWGMPLASGVERTSRDEAWWARQTKKGRAKVGSYSGQGGYTAHRYFLDYPPPASLENPAKKGEFKLRCERCGAHGRFRASRCCGWHTCQRCMGEGADPERGIPLCRWCVRHRERIARMRAEGELGP